MNKKNIAEFFLWWLNRSRDNGLIIPAYVMIGSLSLLVAFSSGNMFIAIPLLFLIITPPLALIGYLLFNYIKKSHEEFMNE